MKKIDDVDGDESLWVDHDVDDVGCIDLVAGLDLDTDFEGVLCAETELPVDAVHEFDSDVLSN